MKKFIILCFTLCLFALTVVTGSASTLDTSRPLQNDSGNVNQWLIDDVEDVPFTGGTYTCVDGDVYLNFDGTTGDISFDIPFVYDIDMGPQMGYYALAVIVDSYVEDRLLNVNLIVNGVVQPNRTFGPLNAYTTFNPYPSFAGKFVKFNLTSSTYDQASLTGFRFTSRGSWNVSADDQYVLHFMFVRYPEGISITADVSRAFPFFVRNYNYFYDDGYKLGHNAGYDVGHTEGYDEGHTAGYHEGYEVGYQAGFNIGHKGGYNEGHTAGYDEGHTAGYDEGHTAGYDEGHTAGYDEGHTAGYDDGLSTANATKDELYKYSLGLFYYNEIYVRVLNGPNLAYTFKFRPIDREVDIIESNSNTISTTSSIDNIFTIGGFDLSIVSNFVNDFIKQKFPEELLKNLRVSYSIAFSNLSYRLVRYRQLNFELKWNYVEHPTQTGFGYDLLLLNLQEEKSWNVTGSIDIASESFSFEYKDHLASSDNQEISPYSVMSSIDFNYMNNTLEGAFPTKLSFYNQDYNLGFSAGYDMGVEAGKTAYRDEIKKPIYDEGYRDGYNEGVDNGTGKPFLVLFNAVLNAPLQIFKNIFNFDLFGVNIYGLCTSLLTFALVIWLIKRFL